MAKTTGVKPAAVRATAPATRRKVTAAARRGMAAWRDVFLGELAATSNVSAAARKAGVCTSAVYEARRVDGEFHRQWQAALCEGYELLEMGLLQRLREGEVKPAAGAKKGVRTFDNATALRLLAAHKDSTVRARAMRDQADSEVIIEAINAKLERMRQRQLAARAEAEAAAAGVVSENTGD